MVEPVSMYISGPPMMVVIGSDDNNREEKSKLSLKLI